MAAIQGAVGSFVSMHLGAAEGDIAQLVDSRSRHMHEASCTSQLGRGIAN